MPERIHLFPRAGAIALAALLILGPPLAATAQAPSLGLRPPERPDPQAEWRAERKEREARERALERERREDWLDWQRDRGGTYEQWLHEGRDAGRLLDEARREDWIERQRPERRDGDALGERLDEQWRRQEELRDQRPGVRGRDGLRRDGVLPQSLRRDRP